MNWRNIPYLSSSIAALCALLMMLPIAPEYFYFSAERIRAGEIWRLITGHLMHTDTSHLFWNCLGLIGIGILLEYRSRKILCYALLTGVISVNCLLLMPFVTLSYYSGLSGALNSLLLAALWLEWRHQPSWLLTAVAIGALAKALFESISDTSMVAQLAWPSFAESHLAGLVGGIILITLLRKAAQARASGDEFDAIGPLWPAALPGLRDFE